ncbi:Ppx/GppA phosphatase family protein [Neomicrococcus lactis]|uniref:Exopolyphosphatase/guanosine-5'-triphosphate, 3'-diphosphate pyrophosphatase n=1 Tax=Neomicrococcus lactis TaxID=732241 RepID=A0A7W9DBA1_9MICC|nr:Ppx/GppA phosphatase family protein [Neomicrococcus lactis]MBB5598324.1 exopolyphosphatase/guanosine-5'-triphosphate,3'-diphosphate pyrophosphatase [Neomicrococcus lactis]
MRVAAIDCGTNSIRLLIADVISMGSPLGSTTYLNDVVREMRIVRLGEGVDENKAFSQEALRRTFEAADEYADIIRRHGAEGIRFVATSATRDASNKDLLTAGIHSRLGVPPEVISGEDEAALSFAGALSSVDVAENDKVLVIDLGGGSTEFVIGSRNGVDKAISVNMGCVRFTERYLRTDPPRVADITAARAEIRAILKSVEEVIPFHEVTKIIGVAGSVTTITAHSLGLETYESARIDGAELTMDQYAAATQSLLTMTRDRRAELGFMHPGRVDVIGAGALIWQEILMRVREASNGRVDTASASEHDILDGIALSLAARVTL